MSTEAKPKDITVPLILSVGLLLAAGFCGFYYLSKNPQTATRASMSDINALEAQIRDLKTSVAELQVKLAAKPAPLPPAPATPATDPALTAALAALAEAQKNQQATLAAIADKLAHPPAAPVAVAPPVAPVAVTPPPAVQVAAPAPAPTTPAVTRPAIPTPVNRLELAYKQAWDSGKPVLVGQIKNQETGKLEGGRTLDPAAAQSLGVASWQEWYASEEKTRREELSEQAERELRLTEEKLVELPK